MGEEGASFAARLRREFSAFKHHRKFGNHVLFCAPGKLHPLLLRLRDEWNFVMLLDICGVDNLKRPGSDWIHKKRFECVYHLLNVGEQQRLRIRVPVSSGEVLPSVVDLWKAADWFEREVWDMFGMEFEGRPLVRFLTHADFVGHPLRKDYSHSEEQVFSGPGRFDTGEDLAADKKEREERNWVQIGPSGPLTRGTLQVMLELDGEWVRRSQLEVGHLHRCFEKICEGIQYNQVIPYTDRLNYCSAAMNNIGWCKAIEDFMGIDIPDRAKGVRMVMAELSRVVDHLMCISSMAQDAGAMAGHWSCLHLREEVYKLFEQVCGARITVSISRIGGMVHDLPRGWINDCLEVVKLLFKRVGELQSSMSRNGIWLTRLRVCPVEVKDAIEWGYTGPCLRASGVNYDLRKASPYYFYEDVDFEVPLGINGDSYDRYLVRVEEIFQSLKIVSQVLDNLPSGALMVEGAVALPSKEELSGDRQALMRHIDLITKGICPDAGEIYSSTEAANGELGFYVISDGGPHPYRVKVRPPCFPIFQSFPEVVRDAQLADAVVTLGSMNVVAGELDR